jgi:hypothetical protein
LATFEDMKKRTMRKEFVDSLAAFGDSDMTSKQAGLLAANMGSLLRNRATHEQDQKRQQ